MAHRDDRFHPVLDDLIDHVIVEFQTGFIRFLFDAFREDA